MSAKNQFAEFLHNEDLTGEWVGEVVDNNDPEFSGRCKVRVYGKLDGRINIEDATSDYSIPDDHLPWVHPAASNIFGGGSSQGAGSLSVPKKGAKVKIRFTDRDIYSMEYVALQDVNQAVIDEVKASYQNSHVLFYDEDEKVKVVYTPAKGLEIFHKDSHILINPDSSITIEHKQSSSIIELVDSTINVTANSTVNITGNSKVNIQASESILNGSSITKLGPAPGYSAVLAEPLFTFLKMMASAIDAKLPSTPGVLSSQAAAFEQLATSKNVKLSS